LAKPAYSRQEYPITGPALLDPAKRENSRGAVRLTAVPAVSGIGNAHEFERFFKGNEKRTLKQ